MEKEIIGEHGSQSARTSSAADHVANDTPNLRLASEGER